MTQTLHLLMGLPGAGKTTLAKILQKLTKAARLSSDEHRLIIYPEPAFTQKEHDSLYSLIDHSTEHLLASGHDVIYDANLNRFIHRQEKYELAAKYGVRVVLWWVRTPKELSKKRRLADQNQTLLPAGDSADKMFERIASILEEPRAGEPCIEIDGKHIDTAMVQAIIDQKL